MASRPRQGPGIQNISGLTALLQYLSRERIDAFAAFKQDEQPMMAVKNSPVAAGFQGAGLSGLQTLPYRVRRKPPKQIELRGAECIGGVQEP